MDYRKEDGKILAVQEVDPLAIQAQIDQLKVQISQLQDYQKQLQENLAVYQSKITAAIAQQATLEALLK